MGKAINRGRGSRTAISAKKNVARPLPFAQRELPGDAGIDKATLQQYFDTPTFGICDKQAWQQQFDGWTDPVTGWILRIPLQVPYHKNEDNYQVEYGGMSIATDVYDGEQPIGDIIMKVYIESDGKPELRICQANFLYHVNRGSSADADPNRLGKGFGKRVFQEIFDWAADNGCERASLHAVHHGSYAWATMGFEPDPRGGSSVTGIAQEMWGSLWYYQDQLTDEEALHLKTEMEEIINGDEPSLAALQQVGKWKEVVTPAEKDGTGQRLCHLGKALLLQGDWNGVRHFHGIPN